MIVDIATCSHTILFASADGALHSLGRLKHPSRLVVAHCSSSKHSEKNCMALHHYVTAMLDQYEREYVYGELEISLSSAHF